MAPEAKRAAVLRAAKAEFARHGLERARMGDVARRAGVGKATLYQMFADKEDLFFETLLDNERRAEQAIMERVVGEIDPWRALRAFMLAGFAYCLESEDNRALVLESYRVSTFNARLREYLRASADGVLALLRGLLLHGVALGRFRPDVAEEADDLAQNFIAWYDGLLMYWAFFPERFDPSRLGDGFLRAFRMRLLNDPSLGEGDGT